MLAKGRVRLGTLGERRVIFNGLSSCSLTLFLWITRLREMKGGRKEEEKFRLSVYVQKFKS